jgi:hypothetical protein
VFPKLDALAPGQEMLIALFSHNPYSHEVFAFHPNADRLTIVMLGYSDITDNAYRVKRGLLPHVPVRHDKKYTWAPHPSDVDRRHLATIPKPFVTLSLTASAGPLDQRSIPRRIATDLVGACLSMDITPVILGRSYPNILLIDGSKGHQHLEEPEIPGSLSMVDRLSAAGCVEALRSSAANVSCESAMLIASWRMERPTYFISSSVTLNALLTQRSIFATEYGFEGLRHGDAYQSFEKYNRRHFVEYLFSGTE